MAARLKTLKVAELKDILTTAGVPFPPRANKADLVAKIAASQPALDAFNVLHPQDRVQSQKQAPTPHPSQNDDLVRVFPVSPAYMRSCHPSRQLAPPEE